MKFGSVRVEVAEGSILAHATSAGDVRLKKGTRLCADDVRRLIEAGVCQVVVATLSPDDIDENEAATRVGAALAASRIAARPASTGRVNLHATAAGVFTADAAVIDAINTIDPAITVATLPNLSAVEPDRMVATVKIIPFGVDAALVERAVAMAVRTPIAVHGFRAHRVGLVQTELDTVKPSVLAKTARVTAERLARSGSTVVRELRTPHEASAVSRAVITQAVDCDAVIVFGASALCDFDDVIPDAIRRAGGRVKRTGMPVDPGNLLVLGEIDGKPVIGAPGCARSPKENGFDWVLDRLFSGLPVGARDVAGMGVGGLLMEIASRPQPREKPPAPSAAAVDAIVLAAGRSSRMQGPNKLVATFDGMPLIRRVAAASLASGARRTVVVTGHQSRRIHDALSGLAVDFVHNPDFAQGLSESLKAGIAALDAEAGGALVVLGDMPGIGRADLDRMLAVFRDTGGQSIVRATHGGRRGNPVLLPRRLFAEVARLEGDTGARHIMESDDRPVVDVEIGGAAALDVDTPAAMEQAGGVLQD